MIDKIFIMVRRIVVGSFLLYGYNLIMSPLNLIIPINVITVLSIGLFGVPALLSFIIVYLIVF